MNKRAIACFLAVLASSTACGGPDAPARTPPRVSGEGAPPVAPVRPVTDTYHGIDVVDPYQWLERDADPEVVAWAAAQNRHARAQLDALPGLPAVAKEVAALLLDPRPRYGGPEYRAGKMFFLKSQPPKEQPVLVVFDDAAGFSRERVILDPTTLDAEQTLRIDWYAVSPDATKVAVSMSRGGTERGDLYLYNTATGERLPDFIEHVQDGTASGQVVWASDRDGFFYTRYPRDSERPEAERAFYQQVWFHQVGTDVSADRYILGKELPRIAEIRMSLRAETGELLITVQNGDGGDHAHYIGTLDTTWTRLSAFGDGIKGIFFGAPGELIVLSRRDAPRGKLLRLTGGETDVSRAEVIVDQAQESITWSFWHNNRILITDTRIHVVYQTGGPTVLRAYDHTGKQLTAPEHLPVGSMSGLLGLTGGDMLFYQTGFVTPGGWYRYRSEAGTTQRIEPISQQPSVDFTDTEVIRELATSRDGTQVPVNIIVAKDAPRDGSRPCIATGYGGYGSSLRPAYRPLVRILLDRGACFAVANLRGGGEFGEDWHRQGMLTHKQNVFDDFAAVLRHLAEKGYTAPDRLGIMGGSNGGLLMGAIITQHPELVRAVVSSVGIYDMLRVEREPNGEFNITEFGTVKDRAQFDALYAYSPYHRVKDGAAYPAILFTHGDNDPRVSSWQSRKMTARLQAATGSGQPILLRTSAKSGHGPGSLSEAVSQVAHMFAFLLHHIGA